jgi:hypothetical protein
MSEQVEKQTTEEEVEDKPIYFNLKVLNLVSTISGILSWVVLVAYLASMVLTIIGFQASITQARAQGQEVNLFTMLGDPAFLLYLVNTYMLPLMTGLTMFMTLQGIAIGLNALLEIDFNIRDSRD